MNECTDVNQNSGTPKTKKLVQGKLFFKSPASAVKKSQETATPKPSKVTQPSEVIVLDEDETEANENNVCKTLPPTSKENVKLELADSKEVAKEVPVDHSVEDAETIDETGDRESDDEDEEDSSKDEDEDDVPSASCNGSVTESNSLDIKKDESPSETGGKRSRKTSVSGTPGPKRTPKQLAREEEKKRKLEERQKEKEERERKKAEEKAEKERAKREKVEEKLKQKQAEKEAKAEEKKRKEEAKEAEKKRKEEEKVKAEEEEKKKLEKTAQAFTSFFTAAKKPVTKVTAEPVAPVSKNLAFVPFQIKENMRIAPLVRSDFNASRRESLDKLIGGQSPNEKPNYITNLKNSSAGKCGPTWPVNQQQQSSDLEIIEDEDDVVGNKDNIIMSHPSATNCKLKAKLLQFHENRRPPYWGTWRKKSGNVGPRKPFRKDTTLFDYEVDSDDEWEEEEPGESLTDSEGEEKEANNEDDYEVDNEFFVPHGYLSDEEGRDDEEERALSPSVAKERLKLKEEEFEKELKKKMSQLKPSLIGCIWQDDNQPQLLKVLQQYAAIVCTPAPIVVVPEESDLLETSACSIEESATKTEKSKRRVKDEDLPDLIRIVHGSVHSRVTLIGEFLAHLERSSQIGLPSKAQVNLKIQEIAQYGKYSGPGPLNGKACWTVKDEVLRKCQMADLSINNTWQFSSDPKKRGRKTEETKTEDDTTNKQAEGSTPPKSRVSLITKFTQAETPQQAKKRVTLTPLPPTVVKKAKVESAASPLVSFLQRQKAAENKPAKENDNELECVTLD